MVKTPPRPDRRAALAIMLCRSYVVCPTITYGHRHTRSLKSRFMAADANYVVKSCADYLLSVRKKLWERFQKTRINAPEADRCSIRRSATSAV
jgi:hypothetical protein